MFRARARDLADRKNGAGETGPKEPVANHKVILYEKGSNGVNLKQG
jgi:hypothetical protein